MYQGGAGLVQGPSGRFLFIHRDNFPHIAHPNEWGLPGGGMEKNETPKETFLRELKEETGLIAHDVLLLWSGSSTIRFLHKTVDAQSYIFLANVSSEDVVLTEGQNYAWLTLEDALKKPLVAKIRRCVEQLLNQKEL